MLVGQPGEAFLIQLDKGDQGESGLPGIDGLPGRDGAPGKNKWVRKFIRRLSGRTDMH